MNDFKTRFNPLFAIWILAVTIIYGTIFYSTYSSVHNSKATEFSQYLTITLAFIAFGAIFILAMKPYIKRTKNYLIKGNSIEEFNVLTSTTKSIAKDDIKGFSTSTFPHGIWKFKEIIIYLKDGSKINITQFAYFNFKNIESALLAKNYNYLGSEPYHMKFFGGRIYKYDDNKINSDVGKKPNNADQGVHSKIELVFIPYLIISLTIVIGWAFLDWLLFTKLNVYPVDERIRTFIIPIVLSVISFFIWLNKKIQLLRLDVIGTKGRDDIAYFLVSTIAIVGTSFFTHQFITLATGKLTNLSSISQIENKEPTKFYTLKNFYLDKKHFSIKKQFETSGKFQTNLEMYVYITVPILNSVKDTLGSNCIGWYGVQYSDTARGFMNHHDVKKFGSDFNDNGLNTIENSDEVKRFVNKSMSQFDNLNLNEFLYLDRISKSESGYDQYVSAIKNNTKYDTKSDVVLAPSNESIAERAIYNLIVALAVFGGASLLFLIMLNSTKLKSEEESRNGSQDQVK